MTEDRWEAFGDYDDDVKFNEGVMAERERIIALLNEMLADNWDWAEECDCDGCIRINKMFALIKGENNA